jgi:hypothetical protein
MITKITFAWERETKNTQRYNEVVEGDAKPIVGALYVRKDIAGDAKNITVSIETE